jgi:hypothetical protein
MKIQKYAEVVNVTFHYLRNQRAEAVEALFSERAESYMAEWRNRDAFHFWCHLDDQNRRRLIQAACSCYGVELED